MNEAANTYSMCMLTHNQSCLLLYIFPAVYLVCQNEYMLTVACCDGADADVFRLKPPLCASLYHTRVQAVTMLVWRGQKDECLCYWLSSAAVYSTSEAICVFHVFLCVCASSASSHAWREGMSCKGEAGSHSHLSLFNTDVLLYIRGKDECS